MTSAAFFLFSLSLSEGSSYLALILVDDFDGFDNRKLPVACFANAVAGWQANGPFDGRASRLDHAVTNASIFHRQQKSGNDLQFRPPPDLAEKSAL
jgi:hypothetical protein